MMPTSNPAGGGFTFGQSQPTNKGLFGTTTTTTAAAAGGFSFGATPSQPATGSTGIGFGTGGTTGGFTLGQPTTQPQQTSGFSFNATQPAAATTTTSTFGFGTTPAATTTATGGFNIGGSTLAPASTAPSVGFSFGGMPAATTSTAPATGLVVPTASAATTTTTASSGFSFGLAATTSAPSVGFSGGGTLGSQMNKSLPFGFGTSATTTTAATSTAAAAPVTSGGLGGVGKGLGGAQPPSASTVSSCSLDANSSGSKLSGKSTKDQQLPPDLFATIAVFEARKNAENSASEENIRQTAAPFHKIGEKAKEIQKGLAELASDHLQLQASTSNLKGEVMKEAEHVEMAKRTKETPMGLQGDNKAPEVFFINLVRNFEAEMMYCRTKIEEVSQCMQAASNPCETQEDIAEVLQREHDTLKNLAAKVYAKHSQLVELSHLLKTKSAPNEQEFFRPHAKEDAKTPASSVVRPVLEGGGSGLLAFQEQQQRAKAVTLGAAPPTMPLTHTTTPSLFSGGNNPSSIFSIGPGFGSSGSTNTFGTKPLFGNTSMNFGSPAAPTGLQQSGTASPFAISSPFSSKPFGAEEEDGDGRRKRRL